MYFTLCYFIVSQFVVATNVCIVTCLFTSVSVFHVIGDRVRERAKRSKPQ